MKLIVGLGNPEEKYANTLHNLGFISVNKTAKILGVEFNKNKGKALIAETKINGEKIILAKPQTYMNLSGNAVLKLKSKYKIENSNIIVIADDIDLAPGVVRYRENGSAGTHNGLRNIVSLIGTDFKRVRIGIGRGEGDLANFVLSKISKENWDLLENSYETVNKKILEIIK